MSTPDPIHPRHLPYVIDERASRSAYYETHWKKVGLDLLARTCPASEIPRLLDYGCGRGEFLAMARDVGFLPEGCDPDPVCVELSRQHGACSLLDLARPHALYQAGQFDVIACFHVLEHVPHPIGLLEYFRDLAPRYLLLAVPNLRTLMHFRRKPLPGHLLVNEGHLHGWDHATFLNLLTRHMGFAFRGWATDTTILPLVSPLVERIAGIRAAIRLETSLFRRLLPYHGHSIIGLFELGGGEEG